MSPTWGAATAGSATRKDGTNHDALAVLLVDAGHGRRPSLIACLADGMGGLDAPAEASAVAVTASLAYALATPRADLAAEMVVAANDALLLAAGDRDMGTTLTCLVMQDGQLGIGHVGDTRSIRVRHDRCEVMTVDHSRAAEQLGHPHPPRSVVKTHEGSKKLARSLGEHRFDISFVHCVSPSSADVEVGDIYVLCSDGVWTELDEAEIANVVRRESPSVAAAELVRLALERDASDDASAIVIAA
jgi:PPM family protein phosphatase